MPPTAWQVHTHTHTPHTHTHAHTPHTHMRTHHTHTQSPHSAQTHEHTHVRVHARVNVSFAPPDTHSPAFTSLTPTAPPMWHVRPWARTTRTHTHTGTHVAHAHTHAPEWAVQVARRRTGLPPSPPSLGGPGTWGGPRRRRGPRTPSRCSGRRSGHCRTGHVGHVGQVGLTSCTGSLPPQTPVPVCTHAPPCSLPVLDLVADTAEESPGA